MITCPDCGQAAPEDARFCEQCGRGLHDLPPPVAALSPLEVGQELQARFKIVEVISQGSQENRYRAATLDDPTRHFVLRERLGPAPQNLPEQTKPQATGGEAPAREDPAGPHSKTQELPPLARASGGEQPGPADPSAGGGLQEVKPEPEQAHPDTAAGRNLQDGVNGTGQDKAAPAEGGESADAADGVDAGRLGTSPGEASPVELSSGDASAEDQTGQQPPPERADLGEVFERVLALSQTVTHPAFYRALEGFEQDGRVYLVYPDEQLKPFLTLRAGALKMTELQALGAAIQICQAVSYLHNRGMRINDICPASLAFGADGRVKFTSLDYVSNDNELQAEPILNDGYTAPEIYRARQVDKRADLFSVGCVLYTCLTGERIECESWRGEAGPIRFYPPHVISPELERILRRALAFRPADRWASSDQLKAELLKLNGQFSIRSGSLTDVGIVREHNEDSVMALEFAQDSQVSPSRHYLYVVSDGMGGAEAGETASSIAVETIRYYVERGVSPGRVSDSTQMQPVGGPGAAPAPAQAGALEELLRGALEQANRDIVEYQAGHPEARGMGATAVGALIAPPEAAVAWVGDSRAYLLEGGRLRQLTKDHSLVQRLVEVGQITPEEARHHEHKNVITRSLGARANGPAGAETLLVRLKRGDRLMLCSDGLMAHVEDSAIAEILARRADPVEATRELVVAANAGGGTDNISVIVIDAE